MKATVRTDSYKRSHGRGPRGTGCWLFYVTAGDGDGSWTTIGLIESYGTYTEAKRNVVAKAKDRATTEISRAKELILDVQA